MISQRYNEQMGNYLAKLANSKKRVPTNADRIRGMSDEELAKTMHDMTLISTESREGGKTW